MSRQTLNTMFAQLGLFSKNQKVKRKNKKQRIKLTDKLTNKFCFTNKLTNKYFATNKNKPKQNIEET
jgi:hypothetical protein